MKIRTGWVANSSSSSFIVAFDREIESAKDIKDFLYGSAKTVLNIYANEQDLKPEDIISTDDLSAYIFNAKKDVTEEEIIDDLSNRYYFFPGGNHDDYDYINGGSWCGGGRFFGTDKGGMKKLADIYKKEEEEDKIYWKERNKFIKNGGTEEEFFNTSCHKNHEKKWNNKERDNLAKELARKDWELFKELNKDKKFFYCVLRDGDGSVGGQAEHGDTFKNYMYIGISHH